jgi:hypothetical protein
MFVITVNFLSRENNLLLSKQRKLTDTLKQYFQLADQLKKLQLERDQWKSRALNPKSILNKQKTNTSNNETEVCTPST